MKISAIGIKAISYGKPIASVAVPYDDANEDNETGLSPAELKAFLAAATTKKVQNVHQDTWNFEETEATVTQYKNQLTKKAYRQTVEPGDTSIKFSIGQFNFGVKKDFKGGVATANKYSAPSSYKEQNMTIVALTEDDVYIVFPKANVIANDVSTDGAIVLAITATPLEPDIQVESIAWISKSAVDSAT